MAKKAARKSPKKKSPEAIKIDRLNAGCHGQDHYHGCGEIQYDAAKEPEAFWEGYWAAAADADRERLSGGHPPGRTDEEDSEEARWA